MLPLREDLRIAFFSIVTAFNFALWAAILINVLLNSS